MARLNRVVMGISAVPFFIEFGPLGEDTGPKTSDGVIRAAIYGGRRCEEVL